MVQCSPRIRIFHYKKLKKLVICLKFSQFSFWIQTDLATLLFLHTGAQVQCKEASLPGSKRSTNLTMCFMVYYTVVLSVGIYTVLTLHNDLKYFCWSISFTVMCHTGIRIILSTEPYVGDRVLSYTNIVCHDHVCVITFYGVARNRIAIRTA